MTATIWRKFNVCCLLSLMYVVGAKNHFEHLVSFPLTILLFFFLWQELSKQFVSFGVINYHFCFFRFHTSSAIKTNPCLKFYGWKEKDARKKCDTRQDTEICFYLGTLQKFLVDVESFYLWSCMFMICFVCSPSASVEIQLWSCSFDIEYSGT